MASNTDDIIKGIRKYLKTEPISAFSPAIAVFINSGMVFITMGIIFLMLRKDQTMSQQFLIAILSISLLSGIILTFASRRFPDWIIIRKIDDSERNRLLLDLANPKLYEGFDSIIISDFLVTLEYSVLLIPIEEILIIYTDKGTDPGIRITIGTVKGKEYSFMVEKKLFATHNSTVNHIIADLHKRNPGMMIGNCIEIAILQAESRALRKNKR